LMRPQIAFKEGVLSRFDLLIPLVSNRLSNNRIVEQLELFGEDSIEVNLLEYKERLSTIARGMESINSVLLTDEQKLKVKEAFKTQNNRDEGRPVIANRPFMILRDYESLARLINIIACVNVGRRETDAYNNLHAVDEDIEKAIGLWENLLQFRAQLYAKTQHNRNILSISDEMILFLASTNEMPDEQGYIDNKHMVNNIVHEKQLCSKSTYDRELRKLRESGRIYQTGKKRFKVKLLIN